MQQIAGEREVGKRQMSAGLGLSVPRQPLPHAAATIAADPSAPRSRWGRTRHIRRRRMTAQRRPSRILPFAAAVAGALVFVVTHLTSTSAPSRPALPFDIEAIASDLGLGIDQVQIRGARRTLDSLVFDAVDMATARSELSLDTRAIERRLRRLPWVLTASVTRRYPGGLDIVITERTPAALMPIAGRDMLIDIEGRVLGPAAVTLDGAEFGALIRMAGDGAHKDIPRLKALLARHPGISARLVLAERIAGRRWTLTLSNGVVVMLPSDLDGWRDVEALAEVMSADSGRRLIDLKDTVIDARLPDRMVIRAVGQGPPQL